MTFIEAILKDLERTTNYNGVNLYETDTNYVFELLAVGYSKEDFKIKVRKDELNVVAKIESNDSNSTKQYWYKGFLLGKSFDKTLRIPEDAKIETLVARYENGVLYITIDKNMEYEKIFNIE